VRKEIELMQEGALKNLGPRQEGEIEILERTRKKRAPDIKRADFLSAVGLVIEKEGYVTNRLLREHFYREHGRSAIQYQLKALINEGILEKGDLNTLVFTHQPGNGNGNGLKKLAVVHSKAPPEPPGDLQPYSEIRNLISQAIEHLEEFKERYEEFQESYQPLLAALLDMEKDMAAFEKLVEILGGVRAMALAGLKEVRRDLDPAG
jgi:hypothetical protein